jgi:hypothetical protein
MEEFAEAINGVRSCSVCRGDCDSTCSPGVSTHLVSFLKWGGMLFVAAAQEQAASLVKALAQYTITLQELENSLLARLANAQVRTCAFVPHGPVHVCRASTARGL